MDTRIFLIGFMGSGKSTLGLKLARQIAYKFIDMDQLIEETAGMTIPEIFSELGEEVFRKWEHDILMEVSQRDKVVISTGGGAPCHSDMIRIMNDFGTTVYIQLSPEALAKRLQQSKTERPLIKGKSEHESLDFIQKKLEERESYYKQATLTVNGINLQPGELISLLEEKNKPL
jgi:shikimate kinase